MFLTDSDLVIRGISRNDQAAMRSKGLKATPAGMGWLYAEADFAAFISRGPSTSAISNPAAYRGGQPPAGATAVESTGHFSDTVNARINAEMERNPQLSRHEAQQRVLKADPSLRQNWIHEHNAANQAKFARR